MRGFVDTLFVAIGIISVLALFFSFFEEFILKHPPCFLCEIQRMLWFSIFCFSLLSIERITKLRGCCRYVVILLLALNSCTAFYHILVRFKIVESQCSAKFKIEDVTTYIETLKNKRSYGCDEGLSIGNIPAPFINWVVSSTLFYLSVRCIGFLYKKGGQDTNHHTSW